MRMRFVVPVLLVAACVGSEPDVALPPDATDGGSGSDTGAGTDGGGSDVGADTSAPPPCDLDGPFGAPVAMSALNAATNEKAMTLTADELVAFLQVDFTPSDVRLKFATRSVSSDPFGPPQEATDLNADGQYNAQPWLDSNGTRILFSSAFREGVNQFDIWEATRATRSSPWSKPTRLTTPANLNPAGSNEEYPFRAIDGLWFASNRGVTNTYHLYFAKDVGGVLSDAVPRDELNSQAIDIAPALTENALRIYFASERANGSKGKLDIWTASRASTSETFGDLRNVAELNGTETDVPRWVSPDGCRLYFSSDRTDIDGGGNGFDLYVAKKGAAK